MNGLIYRPNFLTSRQEQTFLRYTDELSWNRDTSLIENFGFKYFRVAKTITSEDVTKPLPEWAKKVARYLAENALTNSVPNQMTIVNLEPGQGLKPAIESQISIDNSICILTLGANIVLEFIQPDGSNHRKAYLESGSILSIAEEARFRWAYGIEETETNVWKEKSQSRGRTVLMIFRHIFDDFEQIDDQLIFEMRVQGGILNGTEHA